MEHIEIVYLLQCHYGYGEGWSEGEIFDTLEQATVQLIKYQKDMTREAFRIVKMTTTTTVTEEVL